LKARLHWLRDYRWSSYRAYAGYEKAPGWLNTEPVLRLVGGSARERPRRYRLDCQGQVRDETCEAPWESVVGRLVLGGEQFVQKLLGQRGGRRKSELAQALSSRPSFAEVIGVVEALKGERWLSFRDRRGDWGRELALYLGREVCGLTLSQLQAAVEAGTAMGVSSAVRRFAERLAKEKPLRKGLQQAMKELESATKCATKV